MSPHTDAGALLKLADELIAFFNFINEPPQYEDQRMVRDYRHELARLWMPLHGKINAALAASHGREGGEDELYRARDIIASHISCEGDCQKRPNGCGCALTAAREIVEGRTIAQTSPCPLCGGPLEGGKQRYCPACGTFEPEKTRINAGFEAWFDSRYLDPDGGTKHLPDWFKGDMKDAWDAARYAAIAQARQEPTDAQIAAALEWALSWMRQHGVDGLSPFIDYPPIKETIAGMYRAMTVAAPSASRGTEA